MAERRPGDPAGPSAGGPRQSSAGGAQPGPRDLTDRINAAYAASPPIVPDEGPKPSAVQRMGAAIAAATGRVSESIGASSGAGATSAGQGAGSTAATGGRKVRKARLRLTHIDPWSVMKTAFLLSIALGIVTVVAVAIVWSVIGAAGVWDSIDRTVGPFVETDSSSTFHIQDYLGITRVLGFTLFVAVLDVILFTVVATLAAFLYNLSAVLLGGLELTLAEDERPPTTRT